MQIIAGVFAVVLAMFAVGGGCWAIPQYNVYSQTQEGVAKLREAESSRQIRVLEAQASLDSAGRTAEAEIARARGVAEANRIIADSLGGPEGYLRWRYIEMLESSAQGPGAKGRDVIYVPTEAGLPVLEAGRAALQRP